jgi:uncharacterized protein (DUF4415 family)
VLLPNKAIDSVEIPEQSNWENAVIGRFNTGKTKTSVEIDTKILAWFKAQNSRDYQSMINKALFDYMNHHNQ